MNKEEAKNQVLSILKGFDHLGQYGVLQVIDKIEPDHPKVRLPREVGEELDAWKKFNFDENLSGYIEDVDAGLDDVEKAMCWIYHRDSTTQQTRTELYGILADAFRYGWEAEPEELFYVKAPENWDHRWAWKSAGSSFKGCVRWKDESELNKARYEQFTRAELKQYHLDSDIFTLVRVKEDEEVSR